MPDARVIPIDGGERRRRTPKPSARDAVAAGAARATGERSRRRTTSPLIDPASAAAAESPATTGKGAPAAARSKPAARTRKAKVGAEATPAPTTGTPGAAAPNQARPKRPARSSAAATPPSGSAPAAFDELSAATEPDGDEAGIRTGSEASEWERRIAGGLAFVRRRLTGDIEVDDFGFDPELTDKVLLAMMRPLYERYFRVETRGLENVPAEGGALVVANHSGTVPLDSVMTQLALLDHHSAHRHLRMLGADLVFQTPVLGELARKSGTTLACNADAERLLRRGELVGVWPEGFKGVGKPFSERYKLQRFGRGGFVSAALKTRVPIVPCSIVGAEEIYPILGNMKTLARLLGMPYVPVTPTFPWLGPLGMIPLPSKWIIEFGAPIATDGFGPDAAEDPMLVFNITDQVRETIQHTLYRLLMQRRSVFF
jgi:1-acyl-sn-glycerol-3-phosphate acyltransferase